tara:strand:+ start:8208 stop:8609 length:402 start_codon:yes stop_codon:yes gene_type:complete
MKKVLAAIMVTVLGAQALPALAETAASVPAQADMPFTEQFASALTRYRNCVLRQVDNQALTTIEHMTSEAISACVIAHGEVQQQLAADIRAQKRGHTQEVAMRHAQDAMASVDPMIEQAAAERARVAFARVMF